MYSRSFRITFSLNKILKTKMMKKYTILAAMLLGLLGGVSAQDGGSTQTSSSAGYAPKAGNISGAILFGRGNFLNAGQVPSSQTYSIPGTAPQNTTVGTDGNSVNNIVGVELRYFIADNFALKLSGGGILNHTPGRANVPGVVIEGTDGNPIIIPHHNAVVADDRADVNVNLGGEYLFSTSNSRLFPYVGATVPFYYARRSMYDPTIASDEDGSNPVIVDMGTRHAETIGFGIQAVTGVDYYLMDGFYFGFEIKPVSYVYAYSTKVAAPGLGGLQADNHSISFLSQTFMKIGFRF